MPVRSFLSKKSRLIPALAFAFLQILQFFNTAQAQDLTAAITVRGSSVAVSGAFARPSRARILSFTLGYAGIQGLGERVSDVSLGSFSGEPVAARRVVPGVYLGAADFINWSYSTDLEPLPQPFSAAHLSWISADTGLLMLGDLLPETGAAARAKISVSVPSGWQIYTTETTSGANTFDVADVDRAVFVISKKLRERTVNISGVRLKVGITGEYLFTDEDAAAMASEIVTSYGGAFGGYPAADLCVFVTRFPQRQITTGSWEADTRGTTVTVASSDMPFRSQSLQRLHEQLRHELFHLWIPNGVQLKGHYDWFYEGFALYQSLKLGAGLSRIRFEDMLNTLSQAHAIDKGETRRRSLIEASNERFSGSEAEIYARGMLVAFLCDAAMLKASGGKRSTADLVRQIYVENHSTTTTRDGNEAVLTAMKAHAELGFIVGRFIASSEPVDWSDAIRNLGLDDASGQLTVTAKPSRGQKALLEKLGYNNWRNSTGKQ